MDRKIKKSLNLVVIARTNHKSGTSALYKALDGAGKDLETFPGKTAIVSISDGQENINLESYHLEGCTGSQ